MTARRKRRTVGSKPFLTAVAADAAGNIFDIEGYAAVGSDGIRSVPLTPTDALALPFGSELMMLPERAPMVYNIAARRIELLEENPFAPGEPLFAVAAFNSPGYAVTHTSAFVERPGARQLPLFSYGAVGWRGNGFKSALIRVDAEPRQDLRRMKIEAVTAGIAVMRKQLPDNRLRAHLERCAVTFGCPAGKNFFLGRYEAPLPTSRICNAQCLGCISLQQGAEICSSQNRIDFTPTPDEIAGVALAHIGRVKQAVVSFGQGCEGDPLLAADASAPAIALIRAQTAAGTINMNTNGSLPHVMARLFDAGLDSIRVSLNSLRPEAYAAYFRPRGYAFADVLDTVALALSRKKFVAINYLHCPGVTDTPQEMAALEDFLRNHRVHMIQWRNLNYDPLRYVAAMQAAAPADPPVGMRRCLSRIHKLFPHLIYGYFNPPKEKWAPAERMICQRS
ncbi:MAG: radical SAM protein [Pseudomonadota bacterium]